MFGSILHRAIFGELARVFALALLGLTSILVLAGVVAEASQQGLSPSQIMMVIPLLVPSTLPYTIPTTTLFATCVVYGRLSADNEILAIRAAGINIVKVVWPAVLLGALMSASTFALYYRVIPYTQYLLRSRFLNDMEEYLYALLKKDRCIKQPGLNYVIFVRHVQGTHLLDALFKRQDGHGRYDIIARAREADLRVDAKNRQVLVHMHHCNVNNETGNGTAYFEERIWEVPFPPDYGEMQKFRARSMTWTQLLARRVDLAKTESNFAEEVRQVGARIAAADPKDDPSLPVHHHNLKNKLRQTQQEVRTLNTELHMRPALSAGCLCFVLVGCPVGIWFSRSDYLSAFITCFLPVVFVYYPLLLCGTNYAKGGQLHPFVALWASNVAVLIAAGVLFRKLLKN